MSSMAATLAATSYTSQDVCRLARITYRQLDWWCRNGYITYSQHDRTHGTLAHGSGTARSFSPLEACKVVALKRMLDDGITLRTAVYLIQRNRYATLAEQPLPESIGVDVQPGGGR